MISKRMLEERLEWSPQGLVAAVVQDRTDGRVLMLAYMDEEALAATLATGDLHFHSRSRARLWRKGETSGNVLHLRDLAIDCDGDALLLQVDPVGPTCHRGTRSCFDPDEPEGEEAELSTDLEVELSARRSVEPLEPAEAPEGPVEAAPEPPDAMPPAAPAEAVPEPEPAAEAPSFPPAPSGQGFAWLETLWLTVDERAAADPGESYTARLLAAGVDGAGRKVAEEATEVLIAAKDDAVARPEDRPGTRAALSGEVADLLYHTLVLLRERGLEPAAVIDRLRERHRA